MKWYAMKWYARFLVDLSMAVAIICAVISIDKCSRFAPVRIVTVPGPERIVERVVERCSVPPPCTDSVTRFDLRYGGDDTLRCPVGATSHVTVPFVGDGDGYYVAFECHCSH